jgi:hypothetical protein
MQVQAHVNALDAYCLSNGIQSDRYREFYRARRDFLVELITRANAELVAGRARAAAENKTRAKNAHPRWWVVSTAVIPDADKVILDVMINIGFDCIDKGRQNRNSGLCSVITGRRAKTTGGNGSTFVSSLLEHVIAAMVTPVKLLVQEVARDNVQFPPVLAVLELLTNRELVVVRFMSSCPACVPNSVRLPSRSPSLAHLHNPHSTPGRLP